MLYAGIDGITQMYRTRVAFFLATSHKIALATGAAVCCLLVALPSSHYTSNCSLSEISDYLVHYSTG